MIPARAIGPAVAAAVLAAAMADRVAARPQDRPAQPPVSFSRDVLPILSNNCFACHGPDETKRETKFHFDTEDGAFAKKGVIERGNSAESLMIEKITDPDPKERMPPPDSGHSLTDRQIALLRRWIDEGAKWDTHWAYIPAVRTEPPALKQAAWAQNAIDRFILARLERDGLTPSPEADRTTLLRRVTLDLTGLPPTPAEIDAFLADRSPDAYERRVDALLASPHYGERMAMPWLDASRYADTHGYHIDSFREMWHWRDWVIAAFNRNLPFDAFVVEQLAGDLLPNATVDQQIASGFNRNHMINFEGGAIAEEYQVEYVIDRVEATSNTFMGLTMGCARCHSHKFDPISHKEFYEFFAFFNTIPEQGLDGRIGNAAPALPLPSETQRAHLERLDADIKAHEAALSDEHVLPLQTAWQQGIADQGPPADPPGLVARYELDGNFSDVSGRQQHGRTVAGEPTFDAGQIGRAATFDGDTEVSFGQAGALDRGAFTLAAWIRGRGNLPMAVFQKLDASASRRGSEWFFDDVVLSGIQRYSAKLSIRLTSGEGHAIEIRTRNRVKLGEWYHVAAAYDGSGRAAGLSLFIDGERVATEVVRDTLSGPIATTTLLRVGSKALGSPFVGQIDDLRIYDRAIADADVAELALHGPFRSILSGVVGKPSKADMDRVRDYFLTWRAPDSMRAGYRELRDLRTERAELVATIPTTMVMREMRTPRETFVLARGDYRNRTDKVQPGVPAMLPPIPKDAPLDRLTLAKWLVAPGHPLTSRVAVNRFWQMYFGTGIVKTQEDFGVQGEPPVHPELLDWLATEFVRTGWDIRAMQRLIVTSAVYRQSSKVTPALLEKDPENRLLARGPRGRLPAEMIRDTALAASGLLNSAIGGPSVLPYQPAGIWEELAFGDGFSGQSYQQSHGADLYRRGMYTLWKRTAPPASLATFDAPDREKCTARRALTNTPLQALALLNDPTYVEASRALAERALRDGGSGDTRRIAYAFRLATARLPNDRELAVLRRLLDGRRQAFRKDVAGARKLVAVGESPRDPRVNVSELAAWTTVTSVILNLDETITKQ